MDDCGHPLSEDMLTTFGIHPKLKSWPIWLLFPYFCVVMSWQNCRRLPSMRESSCLGGHGTYLQCRNTTRPLAEEMCLKFVRLWWCAFIAHSAHSFYPNSIVFFMSLPFFLSFVRLPFICHHSVFVWTPITPTLLSLYLPVTHSPPHGYAPLGQACVMAYMSWRVRLCVIGECADVHHHTSLICRGWTETNTLTSKDLG